MKPEPNKIRRDLDRHTVLYDNALIHPITNEERKTEGGIILPKPAKFLEKGYIVKLGRGIPLPYVQEDEDKWKDNKFKYLEFEGQLGDIAHYDEEAVITDIYLDNEYYRLVNWRGIYLIEKSNFNE